MRQILHPVHPQAGLLLACPFPLPFPQTQPLLNLCLPAPVLAPLLSLTLIYVLDPSPDYFWSHHAELSGADLRSLSFDSQTQFLSPLGLFPSLLPSFLVWLHSFLTSKWAIFIFLTLSQADSLPWVTGRGDVLLQVVPKLKTPPSARRKLLTSEIFLCRCNKVIAGSGAHPKPTEFSRSEIAKIDKGFIEHVRNSHYYNFVIISARFGCIFEKAVKHKPPINNRLQDSHNSDCSVKSHRPLCLGNVKK